MTINKLCDAIHKDANARLDAIKQEQDKLQIQIEVKTLLMELQNIESLPNCNDCKRQGCEYKPKLGELVRFNCPLWKGSAV